MNSAAHPAPRRLASFALASVPGNERIALAQVAESLAALNLPPDQLNKLKTAAWSGAVRMRPAVVSAVTAS